MRWNVNYFFLFIFIFLTTSANAASEIYQLDNKHTYVQWRVDHLGFSYLSGKWMAQGKLSFDPAKPQNSKVDASIPIANLSTGIKELDQHLMGPLFFDVKKYATATFVSDKVQVVGKNQAKVSGILTLRGISKPILLNVKLNKIGINPITNKKTIGFSGETRLKRSDFGITTLIPAVGDDVTLVIEAEGSI